MPDIRYGSCGGGAPTKPISMLNIQNLTGNETDIKNKILIKTKALFLDTCFFEILLSRIAVVLALIILATPVLIGVMVSMRMELKVPIAL